jgi:hypothetical protein
MTDSGSSPSDVHATDITGDSGTVGNMTYVLKRAIPAATLASTMPTPDSVANVATNNRLQYANQRKGFYVNGLYWRSYGDRTDTGYSAYPNSKEVILRPNGPGDVTQLLYSVNCEGTTDRTKYHQPDPNINYTYVNEVMPDDCGTALDENYSATHDLYRLPSAPVGTINHVTVTGRGIAVVCDMDIGRLVIKTHGNEYRSNDLHMTTSWTAYSYTWNVNPYTGQPWTWDEVDSLQCGLEGWYCTGCCYQGSPYWYPNGTRWTQTYVTVSYNSWGCRFYGNQTVS